MTTILSVLEGLEILIEAGGDADVDTGDEPLRAGEPGLELTVQDRLQLDALGWAVGEDGRWMVFTG